MKTLEAPFGTSPTAFSFFLSLSFHCFRVNDIWYCVIFVCILIYLDRTVNEIMRFFSMP